MADFRVGVLGTWHKPERDSREQFVRLAQTTEDLGFARLWTGDSPLIWPDVYVGLTLLAMNTSRIGLGAAVTHPVLRHPAVTASAFGTLNELSGGRMAVGISAGDSAHGTTGLRPASAETVQEAIRVIRDLHRGDRVMHQGQPLRLTWSRQQIPVYWATTRRRNLALAGEIADGVILASPIDFEIIREQARIVREAAQAAGRDPASVSMCLWTNCWIGTDRQAIEQAKLASRATVTSRMRHSRAWLSPDLREKASQVARGYDYYQHAQNQAQQYAVTPMEAVEKMTIIGTPDECLAKLQLCKEAGIDELMLGVSSFENPRQVLESLAKHLL